MTEIPSNPFHLEAVATYGQVLKTCRDLEYMKAPLEELNSYLNHYFPSTGRYGGTIGLRGGHGSGKTHLLNWLGQEATKRKRINPVVVYAKADHANFFDLYLQIMETLTRERLQEFISEALRKTAKAEVYKAAATEPLAQLIDAPDGLARLTEEGNLDVNQLLVQLSEKLAQVPSDIPRILMLVNSPTQGEKAYQWLQGKEVENKEALGLRSGLVPENRSHDESATPDVIAINALESIAALLHLAERPFIVLIDQLEVLFQVDTTSAIASFEIDERDERVDFASRRKKRQQTTFSTVKKLIEQLGRQNALTLMAGNNDSWEVLPRDVTPRMRMRVPLPVGNLKSLETQHLLEEYTRGLPSSFSPNCIEQVHRLSGGSPREIIRIAYYAYEEVKGTLANVTEDILVKSAKQSGSIADRNKLALTTAQTVFRRFGDSVLKDLDIGDDVLLDLLLKDKDRPIVALATMKATDKLSEVDSARRHTAIRTYLERTWPGTALIVVSVGYSSTEIQKLLGETSIILQFDENTFANSLVTKVTELVAQQGPATSAKDGGDPAVLKLLETIAARLNGLESERSEEVKAVAERFAERTRESAEPERQQRELSTRWDLLSAVDDLQAAFLRGSRREEHELIKAILIANESQLHLKQVDHIGGLYLDAMAEEGNLGPMPSLSEAKGFLKAMSDYRKDMIAELRRILRGRRATDRIIEHPWRYTLGGAAVFNIVFLIYLSYFGRVSPYVMYSYPRILVQSLGFTMLAAGMIAFFTFYYRWIRLFQWDRELRRIRRMARDI